MDAFEQLALIVGIVEVSAIIILSVLIWKNNEKTR